MLLVCGPSTLLLSVTVIIGKFFCAYGHYLDITGSPFFCPEGRHTTRKFTYNNGSYPIVPGLHRLRKRLSQSECFQYCQDTDSCVVSVYDGRERRCAMYHLTDSNVERMCEIYEPQNINLNEIRKSKELECVGGCVAQEKICANCAHLSLDLLVALKECDTQFTSFSQACQVANDQLRITDSDDQSPKRSRNEVTSDHFRTNTRRLIFSPLRRKNNDPGSGTDSRSDCCIWAKHGQCDSNPQYMRPNCQRSCGTLGCKDSNWQTCIVSVNTQGC